MRKPKSDFGGKVLLFILVSVLTLFAGVVLTDWMIMPFLVLRGELVEVPDIVELTTSDARKLISQHGLSLIMDDQKPSLDVPKGCIISQMPKAFSTVKKGRGVYVVVSQGAIEYKMPYVVGSSLRSAQIMTRKSGLEVGSVVYEPSYSVKKGIVISQDPVAHSLVSKDRPVNLIVSSGLPDARKKMPDLMEKDVKTAIAILKAEGITWELFYESSDKFLPNTVIGQSPKAGSAIEERQKVKLIISTL